jgi:hypothetical protein
MRPCVIAGDACAAEIEQAEIVHAVTHAGIGCRLVQATRFSQILRYAVAVFVLPAEIDHGDRLARRHRLAVPARGLGIIDRRAVATLIERADIVHRHGITGRRRLLI